MPRLLAAPAAALSLALLTACAAITPRAIAPELRVLVYNIHAGKDAKGIDALARVARLVRDTKADLVLLQEVDSANRRSAGVDQPAELARLSGLRARFGASLAFQGGQYGIATLARGGFARDTVLRLPTDPPLPRTGGSTEPLAALEVAAATPAGLVTVINTHLDATGSDRYRQQEVAQLLARVAALRAAGAPLVLLGGDFNSTPESAVQQRLRAGLRDLWAGCGRGDDRTFPADSAVKRIDYLYASGDVECVSAEVLRSDASDHRPVLFRLRVPRR